MSTFPRQSKLNGVSTAGPAKPVLTRPTSDFDAGLNSSTAWTEHLGKDIDALSLFGSDKAASNLSKECLSIDEIENLSGRPARVLFDFDGDQARGELVVCAGNDIEILKEELEHADGWSLAKPLLDTREDGDERSASCEVAAGFIPRSYYSVSLLLSIVICAT